MSISLKLFSLINNDAHLLGTRNLEGEDFENTISALKEYIRASLANETQIEDELLKILNEEQLLTKLENMINIEKKGKKLQGKLTPLTEDKRSETYLNETKSIAKDILTLQGNPNSLLFPGGWNAKPTGHSMIYEFKKNKNGDLQFLVHNSGSGLEYHKRASTTDKERYHSIKAYRIPKASLNVDNLSYFLAELLKPKLESIIPDTSFIKNRKYNAERLYLEVFPKIAYLNGKEMDMNELDDRLKEIITIGQRSGTCAEKSLHEMIKSAMPNSDNAKQLIFFYKKYSILKFYHENQQNMDSKKAEQIILAIENLARIIEKNPLLFSEKTIQNTYEIMEKIKTEVSIYTPKIKNMKVTLNIDPTLLHPQKIIKQDSGGSLSIKQTENKAVTSFHEKINIQPLIGATFSQEKFENFLADVKKVIKENDHHSAKKSIENLLLKLPLNAEYYAAIDDPIRASQFIHTLTKIINLYGNCCEKLDPAKKFSAITITTLLSVMGIINEVTALKKSVTVGSLLPLFGNDFNNLINSIVHNPFIANRDSAIDNRIFQIFERNEKISHSIFSIQNYNKTAHRFQYYKDYIQKHPQTNQLNEFLHELFKNSSHIKFSADEVKIIKNKDKVAEMTMLCLLDKNILENLTTNLAEQAKNLNITEINNKLKLERQYEKLSCNIMSTLNSFSYVYLNDDDKDKGALIAFDKSKDAIIYNSLLNFWIKINEKLSQETLADKNLLRPLSVYFGNETVRKIENLFHPNSIYSNPEHMIPLKENMSEKTILECQQQRMMWLLRSGSKSQVLNTLDYFKQHPQILKNKDYQCYLSSNIFQPGLIDEGLTNVPDFFSSVNKTLEYLIDYYKNDIDESHIKEIYELSYLFNQYVLNSITKKETSNAEVCLNKLNERLLSKKSDKYNELILCIQMDLFNLHLENESEVIDSLKALLSYYTAYTTYYHSKDNDNKEGIRKHEEIQHQFMEIVVKHKELFNTAVHDWLVKQYPNKSLIFDDNFPSYILHDKDNTYVICLDLISGTLWENGEQKCTLPLNLSNTPIFTQFLNVEHTNQAKSSLVTYPNVKGTFRQFILETDKGVATYFETPHLKQPYVLHMTKFIEGKEKKFELVNILSVDDPNTVTCDIGCREIKLNLPKTFFCETTHPWCEVNTQNILIERKNKQYLLDANGILHELNIKGDKNGFELVNLKSLPPHDPLLGLYKIFSEFEDSTMIEIFVNPKANIEENQIKINFTRYGLKLHAKWDPSTKQWIINDSKHPSRILCQDQTSPIVGYGSPLFFEDSLSNEIIAYAPMQEFFVQGKEKQKEARVELFGKDKKGRFEQGGNETLYPTVYYHLSQDISNEAKRRLIDEIVEKDKVPNKKLSLNPKSPWRYVNSESIITLNYDKKTKYFKASTTQDGLYLVYVNLCQHNPEKALHLLQDIITSTGLKGTIEELTLIEKIINGTPRFPDDAKIQNPQFIAVQIHVLSLLVHYLSKGNSIPIQTITTQTTKAERVAFLENKRLEEFQSHLSVNLTNVMKEYHHTKMNIPEAMKLSMKQEYELLQYLFGKTKNPTGAIGMRYHQLKAQYKALDLKNPHLRKKEKTVQFYDIIPQTEIFISIPRSYHHTSKEITISELRNYFATTPSNITLPYPGITDSIFSQNYSYYFKLARSEDNENKQYLKTFCENTVRANSMMDEENRNTLLYTFSSVLLMVMKEPKAFEDNDIEKLDILFNKASLNSITIDNRLFGFKKVEKNVQYKPTLEKPILKDTIKITASNFSFPEYDDKAYRNETKINTLVFSIENLQKELQDKINTLISQKYSEGKHYPESEKNLAILDEEIGKLYHENNDKIKTLFKENLTSTDLRKHILNVTDQKLNSVQSLLDKISQDMLILARKGPGNAQQALLFNLQRLGKTRKQLEINDLQRLYVLADLNEYQNITGLSTEEIHLLHQKISDYVQLSILAQQYNRRKKILLTLGTDKVINDTLVYELGNALIETNVCDFSTEPQMQFFQMAQGMLIYPSRKEFIQELLKPESQNIIVQPKMGGGKTKVISPLVNVCKADGKNLVIYQVKKSLFETNYQDANSTSLKLFNQEAIPFEFDRNSPSSSIDLKLLYNKLYHTLVNKNYLITTGDSLKALELKYVELLLVPPQSEFERLEWQKQIKWLEKSLQLIKQGKRLIDEVHEELDPKKRLNYTLGKPENIIAEDIQLQVKFFDFIATLYMNDGQAFHEILKGTTPKKNSSVLFEYIEEIASKLTTSMNSPIHLIVKKLNCNAKQQKALSDYLLDKNDSIINEFNALNAREKDDLAFLKLQLSCILPHTLTRNLFEHYGPSFNPKKSIIEKHLPIPYADNNTPNENSEFGHFIENMNYAIQMAYQRGFSDEFVETILNQFVEKADLELIESPTLPFHKTLTCIYFNDQFKGLDLYNIKYDRLYRQKTITQLKENPNFMQYALSNQVLGRILINPLVIESNAVNSVSMTKTTQAMTGTPYNVRAMHRRMIFNEKSGLGIDGQTTELIKRKNPSVYPLKPFTTIESFLNQSHCDSNLRAIIDVGALFKGISNEQVANELARYFQDDPKIKYILYFDTIHKKLNAFNIKENTHILLNTTDEKQISKILACHPDERFTYYDQASSTGVDIVQNKNAKAVVTVSDTTTRSKLYQGIRRLRQFDENQTISFAFPDDLKERAAFSSRNAIQIVGYTKENELNEMLELHLMGCHQNFHDIIRENLLDKIYASPSPDDKAIKLKLFKEYFVSEHKPNHFIQSGSITTLEKSQSYFTKLENETYHHWERLLITANATVSDEERNYIKNELSQVKAKAITICDELISSKDANREMGCAIEIENKTTMATKIESNTKLSVDLTAHQLIPTFDARANLDSDTMPSFIRDKVQLRASISVNEQLSQSLLLPFLFSDRLFFTKAYAQTHIKQSAFFDMFTKPIQMIMMMTKKVPPFTTTGIIIDSNEAERELYSNLSNKDNTVWFVNPAGTVLGGTPPPHLPKDYFTLLEQIRYLNGDCNLLVSQKEAYKWLDEDKLSFFEKNILPIHLDQYDYFEKLETRTSIINKIMRNIIENPMEDFRHKQWGLEFPGFNNLSEKETNLILQLSTAYHQINQPNFAPPLSWVQSFPPEIASHIKYRLTEVQFIRNISDELNKGRKLRDICLDQNVITFKFCLPSGISLVNQTIAHYQVDDLDFILQHDLNFFFTDRCGENALDALIKAYENDSERTDGMLKIITERCQGVFTSEEKQTIISYLIKNNKKDLAKRLLVLFAIVGDDLINTGSKAFITSLGDLSFFDDETHDLCKIMNEDIDRYNINSILNLLRNQKSIVDLNLFRSNKNQSLFEIILINMRDEDLKYDLFTELFQKGLDPNILFSDGSSPLIQTIKNVEYRLSNLLISNGANVNYRFENYSPLQVAFKQLIQSKDLSCVGNLLKSGAKLPPLNLLPKFNKLNKRERFVYHIFEDLQNTSIKDFYENIKKETEHLLLDNEPISMSFIKYGTGWFDFNYLTNEGVTPLQSAIVDLNLENIEFLLKHDIDFSLQDSNGKSTYDYLLDLLDKNYDDALQILPLFVKLADKKLYFNKDIDKNLFLQALKNNNMDLFKMMYAWYGFAKKDTNALGSFISKTLDQNPRILTLYQDESSKLDSIFSNFRYLEKNRRRSFIEYLNEFLDDIKDSPLSNYYFNTYLPESETASPLLHFLAEYSFNSSDEKIDYITKFIKLGFDINYKDSANKNKTILDLAIEQNDIYLVQFLLENNAIQTKEPSTSTDPKILSLLTENKEKQPPKQKRQHFIIHGQQAKSPTVDLPLKQQVDIEKKKDGSIQPK